MLPNSFRRVLPNSFRLGAPEFLPSGCSRIPSAWMLPNSFRLGAPEFLPLGCSRIPAALRHFSHTIDRDPSILLHFSHTNDRDPCILLHLSHKNDRGKQYVCAEKFVFPREFVASSCFAAGAHEQHNNTNDDDRTNVEWQESAEHREDP